MLIFWHKATSMIDNNAFKNSWQLFTVNMKIFRHALTLKSHFARHDFISALMNWSLQALLPFRNWILDNFHQIISQTFQRKSKTPRKLFLKTFIAFMWQGKNVHSFFIRIRNKLFQWLSLHFGLEFLEN